MYEIEGFKDTKWTRVRTPFGAPSDSLLTGELEGRRVVFLPRHARGHRLLPSELNHRANLYALKKLGAAWIVSVSAVGSLRKKYRPCDVVLPDQFVDRTKKSREHTFFGEGIVAHISFAEPVSPELRDILRRSCRRLRLRVHDGGVYVNMEGPAFSTRAESLTNHRAGYDVVGMTNLGEAKCAREAEMAYATVAMVTDYDCWKEDEEHVNLERILDYLRKNAAQAKEILRRAIPLIPEEPNWPCHRALESAILTERNHWPEPTFKKLKLLIGKYAS